MANRQLVALGVMFAAFAAAPAGAQSAAPAHPSPPKAEKAAGAGEKKAEKAEARADKAEAKADKGDRNKGDRDKGDKDKGDKDKHDKAEGAPGPDKGPGAGPHAGHDHGHFRSGLHRLYADFKDGKIKKDEIKDLLAKLRETASQRRNEHREELKNLWGRLLTFAPVREELRHHARRMAYLNRALFLAQTEVTKDKDKLLERIEKLVDRESERHEKAMERFKATPPATVAVVPAAPAVPAVPASGAAIPASDKKGAEK